MKVPGGDKSKRAVAAEESLAELITAIARQRSKRAFAILFEEFAPRLKAYVMRAGAGPQMAEEITQEAMIAVWRKADSYDRTKASVATWIFTIVRNKRVDFLRREARPDLRPEDFIHMEEDPEQADDHVEAAQEGKALRQLLKTLPDEQAQVLEMAYFEDKSHRVIANELSVPLGTVKSRIRLALQRVRTVMTENQ